MHTRMHTHTLCPPGRAAFFFSSVRGLGGTDGRAGRELMLSTTARLFVKELFKAGQSDNTKAHFQNGFSRAGESQEDANRHFSDDPL